MGGCSKKGFRPVKLRISDMSCCIMYKAIFDFLAGESSLKEVHLVEYSLDAVIYRL